jgi:AhpD family alkylhydroperoxidase
MAARVDYMKAMPEAMRQMRGMGHSINTASGLEMSLLELVRLRASEMNGCHYCIEMHRAELKKMHEPDGRIDGVAEWRGAGSGTGGAYTQRERAALAWAEAVTNIQEGHAPDAVYTQVREHFSEAETANLTLAITVINSWNRLEISLGDYPRHEG